MHLNNGAWIVQMGGRSIFGSSGGTYQHVDLKLSGENAAEGK